MAQILKKLVSMKLQQSLLTINICENWDGNEEGTRTAGKMYRMSHPTERPVDGL